MPTPHLTEHCRRGQNGSAEGLRWEWDSCEGAMCRISRCVRIVGELFRLARCGDLWVGCGWVVGGLWVERTCVLLSCVWVKHGIWVICWWVFDILLLGCVDYLMVFMFYS